MTSEHVRLIAFPVQQWLHEGTSMLHYTYIVFIVIGRIQRVHCEVRTESLRMFPANSGLIGFPLSVSLYQRPSLNSIYVFPLPEEQSGTAWEPAKQQYRLRNQEVLDTKCCHFFQPSKR